ncbi:MAG: MFS transporter, partial [Clostridia bacterium]|nr:MFS transporter [Clostridia bacterium]
PAAYAADLAPPSAYGATMGLYRTLADAGYVLGPVALSYVAAVAGFRASLWCCAALFLVGGVLFALGAPEVHSRPSAEGSR